MHHSQVQPSHIKDQFALLMTNAAQWTDEMRNSFFTAKIADLSPTEGNIHTYHHRVIYTTMKKILNMVTSTKWQFIPSVCH